MKRAGAKAIMLETGTHLALIGTFVAGEVYGVEWAGNLFRFFVWAMIAIHLVALLASDEATAKAYEKVGAIPKWIPRYGRLALLFLLAGSGWYWTAGFYALAALGSEARRDKAWEALQAEERGEVA